MTKRLRQLLVLMHLVTAFGWLAATLAVLLLAGNGFRDAAVLVDDRLLADFSFMTVYTGLMLAGLGPWGYTRFWWVTVKLVLAIGCALAGRALLLDSVAVAGVLLCAAILLMAWIGRTKPWGHRGRQKPWNHPAFYAVALVTPVLDYITDLPLQAIPVVVVLAARTRWR